jgi:hypothetical protein
VKSDVSGSGFFQQFVVNIHDVRANIFQGMVASQIYNSDLDLPPDTGQAGGIDPENG